MVYDCKVQYGLRSATTYYCSMHTLSCLSLALLRIASVAGSAVQHKRGTRDGAIDMRHGILLPSILRALALACPPSLALASWPRRSLQCQAGAGGNHASPGWDGIRDDSVLSQSHRGRDIITWTQRETQSGYSVRECRAPPTKTHMAEAEPRRRRAGICGRHAHVD